MKVTWLLALGTQSLSVIKIWRNSFPGTIPQWFGLDLWITIVIVKDTSFSVRQTQTRNSGRIKPSASDLHLSTLEHQSFIYIATLSATNTMNATEEFNEAMMAFAEDIERYDELKALIVHQLAQPNHTDHSLAAYRDGLEQLIADAKQEVDHREFDSSSAEGEHFIPTEASPDIREEYQPVETRAIEQEIDVAGLEEILSLVEEEIEKRSPGNYELQLRKLEDDNKRLLEDNEALRKTLKQQSTDIDGLSERLDILFDAIASGGILQGTQEVLNSRVFEAEKILGQIQNLPNLPEDRSLFECMEDLESSLWDQRQEMTGAANDEHDFAWELAATQALHDGALKLSQNLEEWEEIEASLIETFEDSKAEGHANIVRNVQAKLDDMILEVNTKLQKLQEDQEEDESTNSSSVMKSCEDSLDTGELGDIDINW